MVTRLLSQLVLAGALLAPATGCAPGKPPVAALVEARAAAHVYHRPAPEVAGEVEALLKARGFQLSPIHRGQLITTQWKSLIDDEQFATSQERYVILVKRLTAHYCRVQAVRLSASTLGMETYHPTSTRGDSRAVNTNDADYGRGLSPLAVGPPTYRRDPSFEWDLLRRVEPATAQRIETDARTALARR
jgi:hypothetical protein